MEFEGLLGMMMLMMTTTTERTLELDGWMDGGRDELCGWDRRKTRASRRSSYLKSHCVVVDGCGGKRSEVNPG